MCFLLSVLAVLVLLTFHNISRDYCLCQLFDQYRHSLITEESLVDKNWLHWSVSQNRHLWMSERSIIPSVSKNNFNQEQQGYIDFCLAVCYAPNF